MYKKRFTGILVRNLILMAIPQIIILVALIFTVMNTRNHKNVSTYEMYDLTQQEAFYIGDMRNVIFMPEKLSYAGFDNVADDEKMGSYYFAYKDGKVYFFILNNESAKKADRGEYSKMKFRIVRDKPTTEHIMNEYIESLGLQGASMDGTGSIYIMDQLKYPEMWIIALKIMHYLLATALLALLLYLLIACRLPSITRQARSLKKYGKVKAVITSLDRELRKKLLYKNGNIYVTESYLIVEYISKVDVVLLDDVRYISKNIIEGKKKRRFQLTLSNVEKMYFEMFIDDEQTIDDVIYYIRGEE